jgi:hypothetical protein
MPPPRRNRGWIWFFVALVVLSAAAITALVTYNLRQQLTPEQLDAAWRLWKEKGPADYQLTYTVQVRDQAKEHWLVRVRGKEVELVTRNDVLLPRARYPYYGMDELFAQVQRFLQMAREPGAPRTYIRAIFHPDDGHLCWFIRSLMVSQERVEITVEDLKRLTPTGEQK